MHFAELKDAWGDNHISQHFYPDKNIIENFSPLKPQDIPDNNNNNNNNNTLTDHQCNILIDKILNCPNCRKKITKLLIPRIIPKINDIIDLYREHIILAFITIFILLTIKLLVNI